MKRDALAVTCDYCGQPARLLLDSSPIYHGRDFGPVYRCDPCDAHVGCHRGTTRPLGRLANAELRRAKSAAHAAFDPMWQAQAIRGCKRRVARNAAYAWLSEQMGLPSEQCHIGMFDVQQCRRVVELCAACAWRDAA